MSPLRFGEFLVMHGLVREAHVAEATAIQESSRIPLGTLAHQAGLLTRLQIQQVVERQTRTGEPFGEATIELGFATRKHIDGLCTQQRDGIPLLGQVLSVLNYLDEESLDIALREFRA